MLRAARLLHFSNVTLLEMGGDASIMVHGYDFYEALMQTYEVSVGTGEECVRARGGCVGGACVCACAGAAGASCMVVRCEPLFVSLCSGATSPPRAPAHPRGATSTHELTSVRCIHTPSFTHTQAFGDKNMTAAGRAMGQVVVQLSEWTSGHSCDGAACGMLEGLMQVFGAGGSFKRCRADVQATWGDFERTFQCFSAAARARVPHAPHL